MPSVIYKAYRYEWPDFARKRQVLLPLGEIHHIQRSTKTSKNISRLQPSHSHDPTDDEKQDLRSPELPVDVEEQQGQRHENPADDHVRDALKRWTRRTMSESYEKATTLPQDIHSIAMNGAGRGKE